MNLSLKKIGQISFLIIVISLIVNISTQAITYKFSGLNLFKSEDSLLNENFLKQSSAISMRGLLAANLAIEKGKSAKVKSLGKAMVDRLSEVNEEIRVLAKSQKVTLPMSTPGGGQRPDGRIDSAPENLQDTSRIKNSGGEAGNTGQTANNVSGTSQVEVSNSIERLRSLSGAEFDNAYLQMVKEDQIKAISLFQEASKSSDKEIRTFANKYLPMVKKSLK